MFTRRLLQRCFHEVKSMQQYTKLTSQLKTPYVIDFYADWCGPCKMLWPVLKEIQSQNEGKWTIIKVNIDQEEVGELIEQHQIAGVPTLAFYKNNNMTHKHTGFVKDADFKQLEAKYLL